MVKIAAPVIKDLKRCVNVNSTNPARTGMAPPAIPECIILTNQAALICIDYFWWHVFEDLLGAFSERRAFIIYSVELPELSSPPQRGGVFFRGRSAPETLPSDSPPRICLHLLPYLRGFNCWNRPGSPRCVQGHGPGSRDSEGGDGSAAITFNQISSCKKKKNTNWSEEI